MNGSFVYNRIIISHFYPQTYSFLENEKCYSCFMNFIMLYMTKLSNQHSIALMGATLKQFKSTFLIHTTLSQQKDMVITSHFPSRRFCYFPFLTHTKCNVTYYPKHYTDTLFLLQSSNSRIFVNTHFLLISDSLLKRCETSIQKEIQSIKTNHCHVFTEQ